jgi:hypothetical protein
MLQEDSAPFSYSATYLYIKKNIYILNTDNNLHIYKQIKCVINNVTTLSTHLNYTSLHKPSWFQTPNISKQLQTTRIKELKNTAQGKPEEAPENKSSGGPTRRRRHYDYNET